MKKESKLPKPVETYLRAINARDANAFRVLVGLVVEEFGFGAASDGIVDCLLARSATFPPVGV